MVATPFPSGTAAGRSVVLAARRGGTGGAAGRSVALAAELSVVLLGGKQGLGWAAAKRRTSARYGLAAMAGNLTDRE
jgi:hypothetical protein